MQAMLFTFAGSGHSNYTSYLLEMICEIELESSPALQEAFLLSLLVNATGEKGGFVPNVIQARNGPWFTRYKHSGAALSSGRL